MSIAFNDLPPHVQAIVRAQDAQAGQAKLDEVAGALAVASDASPLDKLNKTERAYAALLESRKRSGEIRDYRIQGVTLLIGPDCRYTPDFPVVANDGVIEMHEVKGGFVRDDAIVKFQVAKGAYPWFRFVMVQGTKGGPFKVIR